MPLPSTTGHEPFFSESSRLYNLDGCIFAAGAVPLMHAHSTQSTVAVLNLIGSETWINVSYPTQFSLRRYESEEGTMETLQETLIHGYTALIIVTDLFHHLIRKDIKAASRRRCAFIDS